MKLTRLPPLRVRHLLRGIIDIYPQRLGGGTIIVARKWPKWSKPYSERFKRSIQAAKLVCESYRNMAFPTSLHSAELFKGTAMYPLDWLRKFNQSFCYHFQTPIHFRIFEFDQYIPEEDKILIRVHCSDVPDIVYRFIYYYSPDPPKKRVPPKSKRKQKFCFVLATPDFTNEIFPYKITSNEYEIAHFAIPYHSFGVFQWNFDPYPAPYPPTSLPIMPHFQVKNI